MSNPNRPLRPFAMRYELHPDTEAALVRVRTRVVANLGATAGKLVADDPMGLVVMGYGRVRGEISRGRLSWLDDTAVDRLQEGAAAVSETHGGYASARVKIDADMPVVVVSHDRHRLGSVSLLLSREPVDRQRVYNLFRPAVDALGDAGFPRDLHDESLYPDRVTLFRIRGDGERRRLDASERVRIAEAAEVAVRESGITHLEFGGLVVLRDPDEGREE